MPRFKMRDLLIALLLGLVVLGLADYLLNRDAIPLFAETRTARPTTPASATLPTAGRAEAGELRTTDLSATPSPFPSPSVAFGGGPRVDVTETVTSTIRTATASPSLAPHVASPTPTIASLQALTPMPTTPPSSATVESMVEPTAVPTSAQTATARATVAAAPTERLTTTATPAPTPQLSATSNTAPTSTPRPAAAVLEQVTAAEAALRMGQLEATIDYGDGTRTSAQVRFDLGEPQGEQRAHITTKYQGVEADQTIEQITIGERSWQRQGDGVWTTLPTQEGVWGQIQSFLPHATEAANPEVAREGSATVLRWYDTGRDADVTLRVDSASGTPREMRRVNRASGLLLIVTYQGWNTPVVITAPDGR